MLNALQSSPFAALTLIAAPAVLTNASSLLTLGTSNRFARAVDRQRQLSAILDGTTIVDTEEHDLRVWQLRRTEYRAQLLVRALQTFYASIGAFAAASLISLLGALFASVAAWVAVATGLAAILAGFIGVGGLVYGSVLLVRETRITLESLRQEADFSQRKAEKRRPVAVI